MRACGCACRELRRPLSLWTSTKQFSPKEWYISFTTPPTAASIAVTIFAKRTRNGFTRPVLLELYRCNVDTCSKIVCTAVKSRAHRHLPYRRGLERSVGHGEGHEEEERGGAAVLGGVGVGVLVDDRYGALGEGFAGVHPVNPRACSPSRLSAAQAVR